MISTSPDNRPLLDPARKTGLILCGMGGPDGPEAIEPFLRNLFRDPAILPVPKLVAWGLSWWIARKRAPKVRKRYAAISSDSATPQLQTTREQATEIAQRLNRNGGQVFAGVAMRYWHPFPVQTVAELLDQGVEQFLIVPTYPQFAGATTGSTLKFVAKGINSLAPQSIVINVDDWHLLPGYLKALSEPITKAVLNWTRHRYDPSECALLYVAHSLPEKFIERGDPYLDQVKASVAAVHEMAAETLGVRRDFLDKMATGVEPSLTFQSKVGPVKWVGPEITEEIERLAADGCRRVFVQPVSFTCEHVETLHELDIELKEHMGGIGVVDFSRGPALNLHLGWLDSMADLLATTAFEPEVGVHV